MKNWLQLQASVLWEQVLGSQEVSRPKSRRRRPELLEKRQLLTVVSTLDVPDPIEAEEASSEFVQTQAGDLNQDHHVSAADGLLLVNALNQVFAEDGSSSSVQFDVSGDGELGPDDFESFLKLANQKSYQLREVQNSSDEPVISDTNPDPENGQGDAPSGDPADSGTGDDEPGTTDEPPTDDDASTDEPSADEPAADEPSDEPDDTPADDPPDDASGGGTPPPPSNDDDYPSQGDSGGGTSGGGGSSTPSCEHSLSSLHVNEGAYFDLPLSVDTACAASVTVDWGDGASSSLAAGAIAKHMYDDDEIVGTPFDVYYVLVTIGAHDGTSTMLQATVTVRNIAPIALDDEATANEDERITIPILKNDQEPSLADRRSLTVKSIDTDGTVGKVTLRTDGRVHYDPRNKFDCLAVGETATDSFRYTVHDDDEPSKTSTGEVRITIEGRRESYLVGHGALGHAYEDGERSATIEFRLIPAAVCGDVEVNYERVDYNGATVFPQASDSDVVNPSGTIQFQPDERKAEVSVTPVDDKLIEPNEWFFFNVVAESNDDYEIVPPTLANGFKIHDDEWRFVNPPSQTTDRFGPLLVEAFSTTTSLSTLTGNFALQSTVNQSLNRTSNSSVRIRADNAGTLTRPHALNNLASDYIDVTFHCDSQIGDVYRGPLRSRGNNTSSTLNVTAGVDYLIDDIGDELATVTVDLVFEFLVGGTISKSFSPGLSLDIGDQSKTKASGSISLTKQTTHAGGVEYTARDGFLLQCRRGPAN